MTPEQENRLTALESRMAHYERMVEDLSEMVGSQGRTIDMLLAHMRMMREQIGEIEAGWAPSPQDKKPPPHY